MTPVLKWYGLRWPRDVESDRLSQLSLVISSGRAPIVVESVGQAGVVHHRIGLPVPRAAALTEQIRSAVPGIGISELEREASLGMGRAIELRLTTAQRPLRIDETEAVSRSLITALALARSDELLIVQWHLIGVLPPARVANAAEHSEPLPMSVGDVLFGRRGRLDGEARQALKLKRSLPVFRAIGRVAVRSQSQRREQMLLREVVAALRLANAPGVHMVAKRCKPGKLDQPARSWVTPVRLNTAEFALLAGWPIGVTSELPIERSGSRTLPPSKLLRRAGRVIGLASFAGQERPIALGVRDALRHLHIVGPTGTGKSTLLLNLIVQDIAAGRGVVVMEPKGDLIRDVLERIPAGRVDDVVLLDPADNERPVGFNPLAPNGRPPELVADELLGMFRRLYESSWGPRTNDILAASLLTLARTPGMTLCALPALLGDAGFRHRIVSKLDDPIGLEPFWAGFENWSDAERQAAIAPSLNRIRPFLLRPQLRAVLGQAEPRFDLGDIFGEHKILLVNLAKGALGAEAASLLGSLLLTQLWAAALRRSNVPTDRRSPSFVYVDEVQDYLHLPTDLGDALVQARGLGIGFVLAHQHLAQLDPPIRSAILSNAQSRICFQLASEDARTLASGSLAPEDLRELGAYEIYAQVVAAGSAQPWCSVRTAPPPPAISRADDVRQRSRALYGVDRQTVDLAIEQMLGGAATAADDLTPRRRNDRGVV